MYGILEIIYDYLKYGYKYVHVCMNGLKKNPGCTLIGL